MYQPKIKDHLIRKLYFLAKKEKKRMTVLLNDIVADYLITEPDPPACEKMKRRTYAETQRERPTDRNAEEAKVAAGASNREDSV
jgi:hypothetical protein